MIFYHTLKLCCSFTHPIQDERNLRFNNVFTLVVAILTGFMRTVNIQSLNEFS